MHTTFATTRGASLVMAGLLLATAVAVPSAQRRGRADNTSHGMPVATNTILQDPDAYYGKMVTVSAGVERVFSKTVFLVDQRKAVGPAQVQAVGKPMLVIAPDLAVPLDREGYLQIRGQVVALTPEALAGAAAGYELDLAPEISAQYQGTPVLLAASVLDSTYTELVLSPATNAASTSEAQGAP